MGRRSQSAGLHPTDRSALVPRTLFLFLVLFTWRPALAEPELVRILDNIARPLYITHAGDDSGRLFVVDQFGQIWIYRDGTLLSEPFLDIIDRVQFGGERGLTGLAFHPDFRNNGRFFVFYFAQGVPRTVLSEFNVSTEDPDRASAVERVVLEIEQPFETHNGGMLAFGPEGYLYISSGDGGGFRDPLGHGQNIDSLLGAILRIDVNQNPYAIPPTNPLVGQPGRDEIWAYGFRNPWRFSFDRFDGRLFVGDVGQDDYEEIDLVVGGGNYGWSLMEGSHCRPPAQVCDQTDLLPPIHDYSHSIAPGSGVSVTGGYVYRGAAFPSLQGLYVFADFGTGDIWTLEQTTSGEWSRQPLFSNTGIKVGSFGEDQAGELYLTHTSNQGALYRIGSGGTELTLSKTQRRNLVAGGQAVFDIVVSNVGRTPSSGNITVVDFLSEGLEFVFASGDHWECTTFPRSTTCTRGSSLGPGSRSFIELVVQVSAAAPATVSSTATLTNQGDLNPVNNSATLSLTVDPPPDLSVSKSHRNTFASGGVGFYDLEVRNVGLETAEAPIIVTDSLPPGLIYVAALGEDPNCSLEGQVFTCQRDAPLAPGESFGLSLMVEIVGEAGTEIINTVSVTDRVDSNPEDNSAEDLAVIHLDSDGDGVADLVEDQVGDANQDGVPDRLQSHIAALVDSDGVELTLVVDAGLTLSQVAFSPQPPATGPGSTVEFPWDFLTFRVLGLPPGSTVSMVLLIPYPSSVNSYYRLGAEEEDSTRSLPFPFNGHSGAEVGTHSLTLHFIDGESGDNDLAANGEIHGMGAPAIDLGGLHYLYFPQVADGLSGNIRLQTSGFFVNTGDDASMSLEFFDRQGEPLTLTLLPLGTHSVFERQLKRGEAFAVQTSGVGEPPEDDLLVGYARIRARPEVGGTLVFTRSQEPEGIVFYEAAVPASGTGQNFTVKLESQLDKDTGIAMVNPPESVVDQGLPSFVATITMRLYSPLFEILAESTLSLADGEHLAGYPKTFFRQDLPSVDRLEGSITVESDRPLSVVTIRQSDVPQENFPLDVPTLTIFPVIRGRADRTETDNP